MDEKIDKAIEILLQQLTSGRAQSGDEALKSSQAVLNMAHAKNVLEGTRLASEGNKKKPTS